jgi:hypothetical protein
VILSTTSAAEYPSIRSAPTLKIWMTPFASVAMLEKLALLKIAVCSAPALMRASSASLRAVLSVPISRYPMMASSASRSAVTDTTAGKRLPSFLKYVNS